LNFTSSFKVEGKQIENTYCLNVSYYYTKYIIGIIHCLNKYTVTNWPNHWTRWEKMFCTWFGRGKMNNGNGNRRTLLSQTVVRSRTLRTGGDRVENPRRRSPLSVHISRPGIRQTVINSNAMFRVVRIISTVRQLFDCSSRVPTSYPVRPYCETWSRPPSGNTGFAQNRVYDGRVGPRRRLARCYCWCWARRWVNVHFAREKTVAPRLGGRQLGVFLMWPEQRVMIARTLTSTLSPWSVFQYLERVLSEWAHSWFRCISLRIIIIIISM
jgi:hypothetical protein